MKQGERVDLRDPEDGKSTEDSARDDMFVDCPDELTTFDGRQKEEEVAEVDTEIIREHKSEGEQKLQLTRGFQTEVVDEYSALNRDFAECARIQIHPAMT